MTLSNSSSSVKIEMDLSEPLNTARGLRHQTERPLIMQSLQLRHGECSAEGGSASQWHHFSKKGSFACVRNVTVTFSAIEREQNCKTNYMLSTSRELRFIGSQITADGYTFDIVKEFIDLTSAVTIRNYVSLENK